MENPLAEDLDHVLSHTEELWAPVRGERFFITGGTGFVGTWLTESLLWANRRLSLGISAVLLTRNPEAFRQRSPHLACDPALTLCVGDGATFLYPDGAFPLVVHAATERYFPPDVERPASTMDRDLAATRRVLELARTRGTRRAVVHQFGRGVRQAATHPVSTFPWRIIRVRRCPPTQARHTGRASASRNFCAAPGLRYTASTRAGHRPPVCVQWAQCFRWTLVMLWATSSATPCLADLCGSAATARRIAHTCTRPTWRSGCGPY